MKYFARGAVVFVVLGWLFSSSVRAQDQDEAREAHVHYLTGSAYEKLGEYGNALQSFKQAYQLGLDPICMYRMARIYDEKLDRKEEAIGLYRRYLSEAEFGEQRVWVRERLEELMSDQESVLMIEGRPGAGRIAVMVINRDFATPSSRAERVMRGFAQAIAVHTHAEIVTSPTIDLGLRGSPLQTCRMSRVDCAPKIASLFEADEVLFVHVSSVGGVFRVVVSRLARDPRDANIVLEGTLAERSEKWLDPIQGMVVQLYPTAVPIKARTRPLVVEAPPPTPPSGPFCRLGGEEGRNAPVFKREFWPVPPSPGQMRWWRCFSPAPSIDATHKDYSKCEVCEVK